MILTPTDAANEKRAKDIDGVVDQAEHLAASIANVGREQAHALASGVEDKFSAATERLVRIRTNAIEQAGHAARVTDKYVHVSPWRAVGIAAAVSALVGLLAGALLARR